MMKCLLQHHCRTTQSCRHKALISSSGLDFIKKDSWSPRRANPRGQQQARLHTVGFGLAKGRRPDGQPMCGVAKIQVTRVRIDGGVV